MPRFVRPAWLEANADGRASSVGLGPRSRDGFVSARITLRTAAGDVSDAITLDAGGQDDSGRARLSLTIPRGFVVELDGIEITPPEADRSVWIVARPALGPLTDV